MVGRGEDQWKARKHIRDFIERNRGGYTKRELVEYFVVVKGLPEPLVNEEVVKALSLPVAY